MDIRSAFSAHRDYRNYLSDDGIHPQWAGTFDDFKKGIAADIAQVWVLPGMVDAVPGKSLLWVEVSEVFFEQYNGEDIMSEKKPSVLFKIIK